MIFLQLEVVLHSHNQHDQNWKFSLLFLMIIRPREQRVSQLRCTMVTYLSISTAGSLSHACFELLVLHP